MKLDIWADLEARSKILKVFVVKFSSRAHSQVLLENFQSEFLLQVVVAFQTIFSFQHLSLVMKSKLQNIFEKLKLKVKFILSAHE